MTPVLGRHAVSTHPLQIHATVITTVANVLFAGDIGGRKSLRSARSLSRHPAPALGFPDESPALHTW
jgi:hypothetical protein